MIKTEDGIVEMRGSLSEVSADLAVILKSFRENIAEDIGEKMTDMLVDEAVRLSRMTVEGLKTEEEKLGKLFEEVRKITGQEDEDVKN